MTHPGGHKVEFGAKEEEVTLSEAFRESNPLVTPMDRRGRTQWGTVGRDGAGGKATL